MNRQTYLSEISIDWLLEDYVYSPPVVSNAPKEWSIADIKDDDFFTAKVKPLTPAEKAKQAKLKLEVEALRKLKK
jgi:hypothetical protein